MLLQICMGFLGLKDIVKSVNNQKVAGKEVNGYRQMFLSQHSWNRP